MQREREGEGFKVNIHRFRKSGYRFKTMRVLEFSIESRRRKSA